MIPRRPFIEAVARYAGVQHPARNIKPWTPSPGAYKPPPDPILAAIAKHREAYEGMVGQALHDFAVVEQSAGVADQNIPKGRRLTGK